ncbi:MAG: hypothetical protein J6O18_06595 [Bacilli bacterium]|nr:hypothetical protein [Bacilli bacterium]
MSLEELAKRIGKGKVTTHGKISNLVSEGKVKRIGSDKTGHWVVIKK